MASNNTYFAAEDPRTLAGDVLRKAKTFYTNTQMNGYLLTMKKMWCAYYGIYPNFAGMDSHGVKFMGEQGELAFINVNHFRNIAQHIYTMLTSNRPTMEAQAINTDYKSLAQTTLANGILNYYMRQRKLEDCIKRATEMAIILGSAYIKLEWSATDGDIDPETQMASGDLSFTNLSPFDVVFDGTKETYNEEWILTRSFKNKYNLIAKYPELRAQIEALATKENYSIYRFSMFSNDETDDLPVYEFFHKKTEALPDGRYVLFLSPDVILLDTKLAYRQIPVFRIVPSEVMGTPYGFSPMWPVYAIQEAINQTYTTILSNQTAFGVQNIFVPRNSDLNIASLSGGLNVMEGNEAPVPINLTATPEEIFTFLDVLIKSAETISGVNSVSRGAPEASLKSGTALALVQSMALQFMSGLQQSYIQLIEDVGTAVINILQDYANAPKLISIVGKNNKPYLKSFISDDISEVSRVIVNVGNPLARTSAGRIQMAEQMLQMGLLKTPQQYFQILNTGSLETAYEGETDELLLIKKENEKLLDGVVPLVSPLDQHNMHINEHKAVLSDPDLRENPQLIQVVMEHVQKHMDALRNVDPQLLALVGQQSLMPPPMPGLPDMSGQIPGAGPLPPPGPGPQGNSPVPGIMEQPQQGMPNANLPALPELPELPEPPQG